MSSGPNSSAGPTPPSSSPDAKGVSPADAADRTKADGQAPTLSVGPGGDIPEPGLEKWPFLPGYEVLAEIGRGGMGVVYKARQTRLDRLVALKVLPGEAALRPGFTERFAREARALAKLSHAGVVAIYDFGDIAGQFYFLMELVDGRNLRQVLKAGRLGSGEALKIVGQICDALQYAHDEGIIHRDIKPENILVDGRGRVKIADFGLAKLLDQSADAARLTASQQIMGTWHYMAPEQIEDPLRVDHRADIYSLGVVFYEILTGSLPLGRFGPPSEKAPEHANLDAIVLRALEKEPDRRYQSVRDLKTAIDAFTTAPTAAFVRTRGETTSPMLRPERKKKRAFFSATGLSIFCCLLGLIACLPAWILRPTVTTSSAPKSAPPPIIPFNFPDVWRGMLPATESPGSPPANPFETWRPLTAGVVFLLLLIVLIIVGFIDPIPWWRPLLLMATGLTIVILLAPFVGQPEMANTADTVLEKVTTTIRLRLEALAGAYAALILGVVLLLLGAWQLRGILIRSRQPA